MDKDLELLFKDLEYLTLLELIIKFKPIISKYENVFEVYKSNKELEYTIEGALSFFRRNYDEAEKRYYIKFLNAQSCISIVEKYVDNIIDNILKPDEELFITAKKSARVVFDTAVEYMSPYDPSYIKQVIINDESLHVARKLYNQAVDNMQPLRKRLLRTAKEEYNTILERHVF